MRKVKQAFPACDAGLFCSGSTGCYVIVIRRRLDKCCGEKVNFSAAGFADMYPHWRAQAEDKTKMGLERAKVRSLPAG